MLAALLRFIDRNEVALIALAARVRAILDASRFDDDPADRLTPLDMRLPGIEREVDPDD